MTPLKASFEGMQLTAMMAYHMLKESTDMRAKTKVGQRDNEGI